MYTEVPAGLLIGCFMAGLPAAIAPMPFTLVFLASTQYFFGLQQTIPIFISTIVSYFIVCGSGFFDAMVSRAQKASANQQNATVDDTRDNKLSSVDEEDADFSPQVGLLGGGKRKSYLSKGLAGRHTTEASKPVNRESSAANASPTVRADQVVYY